MAREAIQALMAFDDDQIVEGLVWGMNSEQRLQFLRLTEDAFGLELPSETDVDSSPGDDPGPTDDGAGQTQDAAAPVAAIAISSDMPQFPEPRPAKRWQRPQPCSSTCVPPPIVLSTRAIAVVPASPPLKSSAAAATVTAAPVRATVPVKHPPQFASVASGGPASSATTVQHQVPIKAAPANTVRSVMGKPVLKHTPPSQPTAISQWH